MKPYVILLSIVILLTLLLQGGLAYSQSVDINDEMAIKSAINQGLGTQIHILKKNLMTMTGYSL